MATLRHWESVGLLEAPPRWGGKRVFPETVLIRIAVIDLARRAGFRLQEIRQLLAPEQGLDAPGASLAGAGSRQAPRTRPDAGRGRGDTPAARLLDELPMRQPG